MNRRMVVLVVFGAVAVVLATIGGYLVSKQWLSRNFQKIREPIPEKVALLRQDGDTLVKGKSETGTKYKILGTFTDRVQTEGPYLTGPFVVTGDNLKREIRIYVGGADGKVLWGEYQDSFQGKSTWKVVQTMDVKDKLLPGKELTIEFGLPNEVGQDKADAEIFLDYLKQEIGGKTTGESVKVPDYFPVAIDKIGGLL